VADHVFSSARLRGYRVLEDAELGDAVSFQILDTLIASRLWLPFSLIEIAFRNAVDAAVTDAHPEGESWLIATGWRDEVLVATEVTGPSSLHADRGDGSIDDPIAEAARQAGRQLSRAEITRDDLIAHLTLGFWVNRCTEALLKAHSPLDVWALLSSMKEAPLNDGEHLAKTMRHLLRTRNRVAHHEPLLFRSKHLFARKTGDPKTGADLVASLQDAIPPFLAEVALTVDTAAAMAPMAHKHLEPLPDQIRELIAPFEATLATERSRLRAARDARKTAREAERLAARDDAGR
jgi:hypothetical protein